MGRNKNVFRARKDKPVPWFQKETTQKVPAKTPPKIKTPPSYRTVHTSDVNDIISDGIRIVIIVVILLIIGVAFWPEISRIWELVF